MTNGSNHWILRQPDQAQVSKTETIERSVMGNVYKSPSANKALSTTERRYREKEGGTAKRKEGQRKGRRDIMPI